MKQNHTKNIRSLQWDDLKIFLAISREGSLIAAERATGLTQPTMGRRSRMVVELSTDPRLLSLDRRETDLVFCLNRFEQAHVVQRRLTRVQPPGGCRLAHGEAAQGMHHGAQ
ncbi:hypothetical protein BON30_16860 [Cystobacter ferrugineus]|uniref:HTH lysR-type domain-containing protein n=1 Tax=Cystobacter ferrugineus TaxID=83449 RepID=A0A1L9BAC2_9BACT|nr:hypothetical protein BON30_16860 [Cystobacter ferrugineus]